MGKLEITPGSQSSISLKHIVNEDLYQACDYMVLIEEEEVEKKRKTNLFKKHLRLGLWVSETESGESQKILHFPITMHDSVWQEIILVYVFYNYQCHTKI